MTNVMENLKEKAIALIEQGNTRLGSYRSVAAKCRISEATISQVRKGEYKAEGTDMYRKIIAALQIFDDNWVIVPNTNQKKQMKVIADCRNNAYFMCVSEKAGSGKTTAIKSYITKDEQGGSFFIACRKWGNRVFLMNLLRTLGINPESRYASNDDLLEQVIEFFAMRTEIKPILFIDQANSLKGSAFTNIIIHLYNELEGQISVMAFGTEQLQKEITKGVKYSKDGYDETESRFGRKYISLPGSNYNDVKAICEANGITAGDKIQEIFAECKPVKKVIEKRIVSVIEDHRRLKRIVTRELLKQGGR